MSPEEAEAALLAVLTDLYAAGYDIWGWDDGSIQVYRSDLGYEGFQVKAMRHD